MRSIENGEIDLVEHVVPHRTDRAPCEYDDEEERGILMHVYFDTKGH